MRKVANIKTILPDVVAGDIAGVVVVELLELDFASVTKGQSDSNLDETLFLTLGRARVGADLDPFVLAKLKISEGL